jgi:hypothetical protein
MSWSLPRESFSPQRDSRSSEWSVRRPDFWTASFRRVSLSMSQVLQALHGQRVSAGPGGDVLCHPADGGDLTPSAMYFAVGQLRCRAHHAQRSITCSSAGGMQIFRKAQFLGRAFVSIAATRLRSVTAPRGAARALAVGFHNANSS